MEKHASNVSRSPPGKGHEVIGECIRHDLLRGYLGAVLAKGPCFVSLAAWPCLASISSIDLSISIYLYLSLSISIYLYLSLSISIYLYLSLSISSYLYLSLSISTYLPIYLSTYLPIYLPIYLSVCLCLSFCLSILLNYKGIPELLCFYSFPGTPWYVMIISHSEGIQRNIRKVLLSAFRCNFVAEGASYRWLSAHGLINKPHIKKLAGFPDPLKFSTNRIDETCMLFQTPWPLLNS